MFFQANGKLIDTLHLINTIYFQYNVFSLYDLMIIL